MTQAQLATATGLAEGSIQRYLAGDRDINVKTIALMGLVLGFQPHELFVRAGNRLVKC